MGTWLLIKQRQGLLEEEAPHVGHQNPQTTKQQIWVYKDHQAESRWPHVWEKDRKDLDPEEPRH